MRNNGESIFKFTMLIFVVVMGFIMYIGITNAPKKPRYVIRQSNNEWVVKSYSKYGTGIEFRDSLGNKWIIYPPYTIQTVK